MANAVFSSLLVTFEPSSKALKVGDVSSVPLVALFIYELRISSKSV